MNKFFHKYALLFLTGLWLVTLTGTRSIPLEKHEVFVLETARQMNSSGDWVLPRFNGSPRLQKPPLNYWATVLISKLDPFSADVEIRHGRLVSLLAGLLMVLLTYRAGTVFYGRKTGLIAAALLIGTRGFVHFAHNARPDFLYAFFSALQLFAWMNAWKTTDRTSQQRWSSLLGWAAAALATLTKGPHVPAVFLLGLLLFLVMSPDRKRCVHILRPLSGALLFCIIILPWWIVLNQRVQALGVNLGDSQLSGSLLHNLAGYKEMLSGYYLWDSISLIFPFSVLIPFVLKKLWENRGTTTPVTQMLMTVTVVLLTVFTFGGHYRKHYLLPLLPVFALFLSRAFEFFAPAKIPDRWRKILIISGSFAILGCAGVMVYRHIYSMLLILPVCTLLLFLLLRKLMIQISWRSHPLAAQLLSASVLLTVLMSGYNAFWPAARYRAAEQSFSEAISRNLPSEAAIVDWNADLELLPYYAKRMVPSVSDRGQFKCWLIGQQAEKPLFAVLPASELDWLGSEFKIEVLLRAANFRNVSRELVLVKIYNHPDDTPVSGNTLHQHVPGPDDDLPALFLFLKIPPILNTI